MTVAILLFVGALGIAFFLVSPRWLEGEPRTRRDRSTP